MDLACLDVPRTPFDAAASDGSDLVGPLLFVVFVCAAAASPVVRSRYRRWVARLMALDQVQPRPAGWWTPRGQDAAHSTEAAPLPELGLGASRARAAEVRRRITRATLVAWAVFSLLAAAFGGVIGEGHGAGTRAIYVLSIALFAIGPALMNLPEPWSKRALPVGVIAAIAGAVLLERHDPEASSLGEVVFGALIVGTAYFVMFRRSLSGQVMPLFVAFGVCAVVFFVPMVWLDAHAGNCFDRGIEAAAAAVAGQLGGEVTLIPKPHLATPLLLLAGTAFGTLALWLGFRSLAGLIWLADRGWFNELSLAAFLTLALVVLTMVQGAPAADTPGDRLLLATIPLLWLGATAVTYFRALGREPARGKAPQLLILRVFSAKSRDHALLDDVQQRWRYLGPVHQIGGPDLVTLNVDLHECSMFLAGRLHELFLPQAASAAQLQARLRDAPDREGRYRINEVFCFNTAWRSTVAQLMELSEAILLDLRGFTLRREGTGYEIGLLARAGLLRRVVAVGDAVTSWPDVDALLVAAGAHPSELVRLHADATGAALFAQLVAAAGGDRVAPGGDPRSS